MKKVAILLTLCVVLLSGCSRKPVEFTTRQMEGHQLLLYSDDERPHYVENSYSVAWPADGLMSGEAERELLIACFGDSTATTFEEASQRWLRSLWTEDPELEGSVVSGIPDTVEYSYYHLESDCIQDSSLAKFNVKAEWYGAGAAHGLYSFTTLTVDKATGNVVHLPDLVTDTNLLCEAIARAIQDLETNREVRDCLFDEFRDAERMPMPGNFGIDSARNGIIVDYGLYEIAPYACGIQSVVLPIFWLSKHVSLTPYAKRLFGPGSYLE